MVRVGAPSAPKGGGPKEGGLEGWGGPEGGGPKPGSGGPRRVEGPEGWEAKNFALFFPLPPQFLFLSSLSWKSSRGILVVFEAPGN